MTNENRGQLVHRGSLYAINGGSFTILKFCWHNWVSDFALLRKFGKQKLNFRSKNSKFIVRHFGKPCFDINFKKVEPWSNLLPQISKDLQYP